MIELINVTKRFGKNATVNNVTFEVKKGEITGFLGPNGAGKTTTMRMITGFFSPTEGSINVAGIDILKDPIAAKRKIGYMPENVPLYKELTVYGYLKFIAEVKGVKKGEIAARIEKAMEEAGVSQVRNKIIGNLSKGYRQRTGIAQAILNDPEVLILDEPTSGLDPKQIKEIRNLIKNMKGERTIILSTHILPEVSMTCDKVVVINEGKIIVQDDVYNVENKFHKSSKVYVEVKAPKTDFAAAVKKIKGVAGISVEKEADKGHAVYSVETEEGFDVRGDIVRCIVKNRWDLLELKRQSFTLEDVFLKLVTKEDA
ncbi:MAG TPA: ABC transporter ATP-binding protein [Firmicutes bacterium]|nr:ABC transporter ATP-binding protein [Bacillota bacterium]